MEEERRGRRRFTLAQPITLNVGEDGQHEINGRTENVSLTGLLVLTDTDISDIPQGTLVEVTLILVQPGTLRNQLLLSNSGRVVRVETRSGKSAIAIACERAFEQATAIHTT